MNPFIFSYFFVSLIILLVGSYTDLKERMISNKLTYGGIIIGILIHLIESIYLNDYFIAGTAIGITIATFVFSWGLWKIGVWAGGDVKLFTALAALNPFNLGFIRDLIGLQNSLLASIAVPIFPLTLFVFSIFSMLPYGMLLSINALKEKKELRKELMHELKEKLFQAIKLVALITGLNFVLINVFGISNGILLFVLIIVLLIASAKLNWKIRTIIIIVLFGYAVYSDFSNAIKNFLIGTTSLYAIYVLLKMFSFSRTHVLKKKINVNELEEGMIPAVSLYEVQGKIIQKKPLSMANIIKYVRDNNLEALMQGFQPKGKEIISTKKAAGIEKKEIQKIKKLAEENKIPKEIEIKLTAPMIPAVLIGYLLVNLTGDLIWNLL